MHDNIQVMSHFISVFKEVKSRAYQTSVRSQFEYAADVCNHYNITTADRFEYIQHATARFVHHEYRRTTSVNNLINILDWDHLHTMRLVTMIHKIYYRLVSNHIPQLISPATFIGKHDHQQKYAIPVAIIDSNIFSFYPHYIRLWNQLPSTTVFAASPAPFHAFAFPAIIGMKSSIVSKML